MGQLPGAIMCELAYDLLALVATNPSMQLRIVQRLPTDHLESLLIGSDGFVDPYGGIYKPKASSQRILPGARSLHRITIFHPDVHYPKPAIPYWVLPDELLHHFQQVFEQDRRGVFPKSLLDNLRWTHCPTCGQEHARSVCPLCQAISVGPIAVRASQSAGGFSQTSLGGFGSP